MRQLYSTIFLFILLYIEVLVQFPLFLLGACVILFFTRTWFMAGIVLFLSLLLDSLMVHVFGITAICIFGYIFVTQFFLNVEYARGRIVFFITLLLTGLFYSMVVEYSAHVGSYILLCTGYGIFELALRRRNSSHTLQWV